MTPLRLIITGLGARARTWLQVASDSPDVEIVGLCDPDPAARDRAREAYPGRPVAAALEDIIGTVGVEAVLLCTPPAGRLAQITVCCDHGLAILAEKPLSDDVATAARFVAMAEAAGVPLIVGLNFRYLAVTQAMRHLLTDGPVGSPGFGRFTYERWRDGTQSWLNSYPLTMDHPMLWEQSIHHFDLMRYVYGVEPVSIQAHTFNPDWTMYAGDTNVSALIHFDSGLTVNYQGTWQAGHEPMNFNWRTDCDGGIVMQRDMFGDLAFARRMDPEMTPVPLPDHTPWISDARALLNGFVATCRGAAPDCTGRDHLQSLMMLEGCIRASARRESVDMEEIRAGLAA
ncbi:Gfo/Idh/MocA family oxidoreductase [Rhodophyticola sp. CCM32]|uniref:Gfo/Idh/MocA family protein n=1 Tax=Rhodophyticola sp. CCM32 TaxID=2916397 RepID=UPI00107FA8C6|nr:Gfo/Idh/MocA family oxidoreductase [Rhodophyticola sp. CCM32]QBX99960.1 Gfo/Idh/MocA family oxidoreductase [Rhodophyticola sp. CCM32]